MVKSRLMPMCGASRRRSRAHSAVERRDPHRAAVHAEQRLDPLAHLSGGLVGEGDRHDLVGIDEAFGDQERDAMGDDARFPRTRTGEDQQRPFGVADGRLLFGIEGREEVQPAYSTVTLLARFLG